MRDSVGRQSQGYGGELLLPSTDSRENVAIRRSTSQAASEEWCMETGSFHGQSTPRAHPASLPGRGFTYGLSARARSSSAVSALDPTFGSHNGSPENSPISGAVGVRDCSPSPPDSYVLVRKSLHPKAAPSRSSSLLLKFFPPMQRRLVVLVMLGLLAGGLLHGFVLWKGLTAHVGPYARSPPASVTADSTPFPPALKDPLNADVRLPPLTTQEAQKLGMPGDSDRLPNQPVWNAGAWNFTPRANPEDPEWPNTVAICAIMKGEHPDDVVQWLKYHMWLGVDTVFLRENAATLPPNLLPRVQGMISSGFLDLGTLPGSKHPLQNRWYNRCSKPDMAGMHSWVAFIDLDEFMVVLKDGIGAKNPDLKGVLRSFKGNAGLSMQWVLFGSSGHVKRPTPGGPLAHYHQCTGHLSFQMKCMANMYHATHHMMVGNTVHDCTYRLEDEDNVQDPPVTLTDGTPLHLYQNNDMTNPKNDSSLGQSRTYVGHLDHESYPSEITSEHKLVLFHYVTRSLEDYTSRKVKLPSGKFTYDYVSTGKKNHEDIKEAEVMAAFEHRNGFDGKAPVCSSAQKAFYAGQCCSGS